MQDQKKMRIVTCCHSDITSGHLGIAKTVARIKEQYMWKGIIQDVKDLVTYISVRHITSKQ